MITSGSGTAILRLTAVFVTAVGSVGTAAALDQGAAMPLRVAQAAAGEENGRAAPPAVRPIAPNLVAPPQVGTDGLERAGPRAPLGEIGLAGPPKQRQGRDVPRLHQPVATAAGRIETDGLTIAVAGIEIVEPAAMCPGNGEDWPCGMRARTAFRSFLRARALDCDLPEGDLPPVVSVTCRVGGRDLGAWLVANGWAKAAGEGPYGEEQRMALENRRGIFGEGPAPLPAPAPLADTALPAPEPPSADGG